MPGTSASVAAAKALPISLSARLRERVPLASPLASSSKERSLASSCGDIDSLSFPKRGGGLIRPAKLYTTKSSMMRCKAWRNFLEFSLPEGG